MNDEELMTAIRDARDRGDQLALKQLEQERIHREQQKEQIKLDVLKAQVERDAQKLANDDTMKTKTLNEEEEQDVQTAQEKPTSEREIKKEERHEEAKQQSVEYQQDVG